MCLLLVAISLPDFKAPVCYEDVSRYKAVLSFGIMLTHIVCWKYKPEVTEEQRRDHIDKLRALPDAIPDIVSFSVGADILHLDRSFDTGLVVVFPSRESLDIYTDHPVHQEVAALGRSIAEKAVSVDFLHED